MQKYPNQLNYALDHINLIVEKGEFVAVMGRSGSGKTTLLNVTSIIDKIDSGNIYCADKEISTFSDKEATNFRKNDIGFVFQDYMLLDSLTIRENISVALSLKNVDSSKIDDLINSYAKRFNLYEQLKNTLINFLEVKDRGSVLSEQSLKTQKLFLLTNQQEHLT